MDFYNKLNISKEEFLFQFQSHPNYPSALAFSDTLNFLGIKNDTYEVEKQNWQELPNEFLAVYKGIYAVVERQNQDYFVYAHEKEKLSTEQLYDNTENIVVLFETTEEVGNTKNFDYRWVKLFFVLSVLVCFYIKGDVNLFMFNLLSSAGVLISLEIFHSKFGVASVVINALCNVTTNNNSNTVDTCKKIIASDKIDILGLKLSDFSLIYFLSIFILGMLTPQNVFSLKIISYSTAIVIIYSLFVQIFIEKAFCKVCLLTISILIGQIFIASLFPNIGLNFEMLSISLFVFTAVFFSTKHINDILKLKNEYYNLNIKNSRFKRDYSIFRKELLEKNFDFKNKSNIFWFGNKKGKLNIILITNPFCGYCKEAHSILERLIIKYPDISAQIRFNYFQDENLESILSVFKNIYDNEGEQALLKSISLWYEINNAEKFIEKHPNFSTKTDISEITALAGENRNYGLTFTPVFLINNYQFPTKYEREDIFYFIDELLEDEEILNENI